MTFQSFVFMPWWGVLDFACGSSGFGVVVLVLGSSRQGVARVYTADMLSKM